MRTLLACVHFFPLNFDKLVTVEAANSPSNLLLKLPCGFRGIGGRLVPRQALLLMGMQWALQARRRALCWYMRRTLRSSLCRRRSSQCQRLRSCPPGRPSRLL